MLRQGTNTGQQTHKGEGGIDETNMREWGRLWVQEQVKGAIMIERRDDWIRDSLAVKRGTMVQDVMLCYAENGIMLVTE